MHGDGVKSRDVTCCSSFGEDVVEGNELAAQSP